MKYNNLKIFEEYFKNTNPKELRSIYCILTKNLFDLQQAHEILIRNLPLERRDLSLESIEGAEASVDAIAAAVDSSSLFVPVRAISIVQIEKLKKEVALYLEKRISQLPPSLFLILAGASWHNTSLYKAIEKNGVVFISEEKKLWQKEKELIEWVEERMREEGKHISRSTCHRLVQAVGQEAGILTQEINKLLCFCAERNEVTVQDIEAVGSKQFSYTVWQLGEAIFSRNIEAALLISHRLLLEGPLLPLLRALRSQFQTDYQVSLLIAQGKEAHITQEFPFMKGKILEQHIHHAREYGMSSFKRGLLAIDFAESQIKTTSISEKAMMGVLISKLTNSV